MLIRFWVENYRCFRDRVGLDFTDKKNYSYGKECVRGDFLDKVIILGDNGAGKTSLGYALSDIIITLTGFSKDIGQCTPECFLNGDIGEGRAVFHYEFTTSGTYVEYEYGKIAVDRIVCEKLTVNRRTVFNYDLENMSCAIFNMEDFGLPDSSDVVLDGSVALLRVIGSKSGLSSVPWARAILDFARDSVYYRAMWRMDEHIGILDGEDDICNYVIENGLVESLQSFLNEECYVDTSLGVRDGDLIIRTERRDLPFLKAASRGTILLTRLFCWERRSKNREALMYLDDFDDMFHYTTSENVMEYIIRHTAAQCVFVTHNPDLISSDALRPDCCFLLEDRRIESLSNLTDKSIRKGHNLTKMLREGEFRRSVI